MAILEWIRFILGTAFLIFGLVMFVIEIMGVYHMKYVLNRMHLAATGDTLGIGLSLVGLMIMSGLNFTTLKLLLVVVFLWLSSPVSSHLIARMEAIINPNNGQYETIDLDKKKKNENETRDNIENDEMIEEDKEEE